MLKIEIDKLRILTEIWTEELTVPFRLKETKSKHYKIMCDDERIYIFSFVTEGPYEGEMGSATFFQRENLKQVIQAIEDWLNPDLKISEPGIMVTDNNDKFGVSFGYPDRFDVRPVLMLSTNIKSEINDSEALGWDLVTNIDTGSKLIAELKKANMVLNQPQAQGLLKDEPF